MTTSSSERAMTIAAVMLALAVPAWLLWPRAMSALPESPLPIIRPGTAPDLARLDGRRLFSGEGDAIGVVLPADAPDLIGVIGRPPHDAVALIRAADGTTKALARGASFAGWRLEAVSAEAALFSRGPLNIRVPMPPAEAQVQ